MSQILWATGGTTAAATPAPNPKHFLSRCAIYWQQSSWTSLPHQCPTGHERLLCVAVHAMQGEVTLYTLPSTQLLPSPSIREAPAEHQSSDVPAFEFLPPGSQITKQWHFWDHDRLKVIYVLLWIILVVYYRLFIPIYINLCTIHFIALTVHCALM